MSEAATPSAERTRWYRRLPRALRTALERSPHSALTLTAVGAAIITGLTAASAGIYDAVAEKNGLTGFDRPTLDLAISLRTSLSDRLITSFTELGAPRNMAVLAACLTLAMAWRWRSATPVILMATAFAGSLTFARVGKEIVRRGRPPLGDGPGGRRSSAWRGPARRRSRRPARRPPGPPRLPSGPSWPRSWSARR